MIIRKDYKFYAAHRNEELADKCHNIHGHRYGISLFFEVERQGSISTLFGDFDGVIEPFLKAEYDHGMLINVHDPLYETLRHHTERTGECFKLKKFDVPTSVENLAFQLFTEIAGFGFRLDRLEIRETDTSVVLYTHADWLKDRQRFGGPVEGGACGSCETSIPSGQASRRSNRTDAADLVSPGRGAGQPF
ncbi:MAG: 6-pyruvoyl trahydropterin synthase family protein [Thermoguttaceae bacterium]